MEKLTLPELVILLKRFHVSFNLLCCEDVDGSLVDVFGHVFEIKSDEYPGVFSSSDEAYDEIAVLIKLLKAVLEYRPLPF